MPSPDDLWVLDTHVWIRVLNADPLFDRTPFPETLNRVAASGGIRIADITLWETAMLVSNNRLKLGEPLTGWMRRALLMPGLEVTAISADIASDGCSLPGDFHGDPADRLITATARTLAATLITLDEAMLSYGEQGWVRSVSPLGI